MQSSTLPFGYCPLPLRISGNGFSIEPLDDLESIVAKVGCCKALSDGWLYRSRPPCAANSAPDRVFGLPKTHKLSIRGTPDDEKIRFTVWCLSFLVGMRLTTTEAGFLDATPVKPRVLVDFFADDKNIVRGLERALRFYDSCPSVSKQVTIAKRYEAAIHALFLAQNPANLAFEEFSYLYMALDTCYRLMSEGRNGATSHATRVHWMCDRSKMSTPAWARPRGSGKKRTSPVSRVRNAAVHEAIYMGEPLGFSVMDPSTFSGRNPAKILLEMRALICRLLIFILDEQAGLQRIQYVESPIDTRSAHDVVFS